MPSVVLLFPVPNTLHRKHEVKINSSSLVWTHSWVSSLGLGRGRPLWATLGRPRSSAYSASAILCMGVEDIPHRGLAWGLTWHQIDFISYSPASHQIVAAPVHCSKFVVPITPRSARVLVGTQTGQCLTVEGVHTKLRLFSLLRSEGDELFVLSQLEQSKKQKNENSIF